MSNYIMDLRKEVGHRPILQVGASVIVEDHEGRILLQLRSDNHMWGYAGGSVELDEIVEEAAKRELFEETGLVAEKLELFGIFSGPDLHYVYPNGDEVSNIDLVYLCTEYTGQLCCQKEEVEDLQFFAVDELPELLTPPNRRGIKKWIAKKLQESVLQVNFYDEVEDEKLKFAVIVATYQNQWILCKHKLRTTYELPGGHRENDETILETAKRELQEETGATQFVIQPVCAYSVLGKTRVNATGNESFGMLYYAKIETLEELHAEIESIALFDEFPLNLTYPLIQPYLLKEVKRRGFIK